MSTIAERRREATRQGIYEAAVVVLIRDGLDRATMYRVAQEARISKGSLYNYFRSKTDFLEFVFEKTVGPLDERILEIVNTEDPAEAKLRCIFHTILEYLGPRRRLFSFLMSQQAPQNMLAPRNASGPPMLARLIQQGIEEGVFKQCDPLFHATLMYGAMHAFADDYVNLDDSKSVDEIAEAMTQFFICGIAASPARN